MAKAKTTAKAKGKTKATAKPAPRRASAKPAKKAAPKAKGAGTRSSPWTLTTPSGGSEFAAFRDETLDPPALVVHVGKTELRYHLRNRMRAI
jgi:hypothetical protein